MEDMTPRHRAGRRAARAKQSEKQTEMLKVRQMPATRMISTVLARQPSALWSSKV